MVEKRPFLTFLAHLVLILGVFIVALPVWVALVASTHASNDFLQGTVPMWFGDQGYENYSRMLGSGISTSGMPPVGWMMFNSLVMALGVALGLGSGTTGWRRMRPGRRCKSNCLGLAGSATTTSSCTSSSSTST